MVYSLNIILGEEDSKYYEYRLIKEEFVEVIGHRSNCESKS